MKTIRINKNGKIKGPNQLKWNFFKKIFFDILYDIINDPTINIGIIINHKFSSIFSKPLRLETLKLAKPAGTKVVVKNQQEAIDALNSGVTDKYKLFIICENLENAKRKILNVRSKHILANC